MDEPDTLVSVVVLADDRWIVWGIMGFLSIKSVPTNGWPWREWADRYRVGANNYSLLRGRVMGQVPPWDEPKNLFAQGTVEIEGGADEGEMRKGLREISEGFSMLAGFFCIQA